jgi:hypothetical protein
LKLKLLFHYALYLLRILSIGDKNELRMDGTVEIPKLNVAKSQPAGDT